MYLGLVPIVEKLNGMRELFHDLPVIEIESWESIRSPHYLWVVIHDEFRKKFLKQRTLSCSDYRTNPRAEADARLLKPFSSTKLSERLEQAV